MFREKKCLINLTLSKANMSAWSILIRKTGWVNNALVKILKIKENDSETPCFFHITTTDDNWIAISSCSLNPIRNFIFFYQSKQYVKCSIGSSLPTLIFKWSHDSHILCGWLIINTGKINVHSLELEEIHHRIKIKTKKISGLRNFIYRFYLNGKNSSLIEMFKF